MGIIVDANTDPTSVDTWAIVINLIVVNIVQANYADATAILENDSPDYMVDTSVGGQAGVVVGFTYDPVADAFTAPALPPLATCQAQNLQAFNAALLAYNDGYFSIDTKLQFFIMYYMAVQNGLTNRAAYIQPLFTYANSVLLYAATYSATIMAMTNPATVVGTTWSFAGLTPPAVTLIGAISIPN